MYHVYLIKSTRFDWVYVGSTANLGERLKKHNSGGVKSTSFRKPFVLIYKESFSSAIEARKREKEIKLNRRVKEAIVSNSGLIV